MGADAFGGIGLEVPDVDGRGAAAQPDQDDGVGLGRRFGGGAFGGLRAGLEAEQLGQTQPQEAGRPDREEVPAVEPLAVRPA